MTKPRGIHANFAVDCECGTERTFTNGKPDPHKCHEQPLTLESIKFPTPWK